MVSGPREQGERLSDDDRALAVDIATLLATKPVGVLKYMTEVVKEKDREIARLREAKQIYVGVFIDDGCPRETVAFSTFAQLQAWLFELTEDYWRESWEPEDYPSNRPPSFTPTSLLGVWRFWREERFNCGSYVHFARCELQP